MALIIGLSTTGAILLIVAILIFLYFDPFGWEVFSTKRFRARYKELSEPFVSKEIRKFKEQEIESLKQTDSTDSLNKLMLETEIAKARVEGLSLIS